MRFIQGDLVSIKIRDGLIVGTYDDEPETKKITVEVVALVEGDEGYLILVPNFLDIYLKNNIKITVNNYQSYGILKRFISSEAHFVSCAKIIDLVRKFDGMLCERCEDFVKYAEPNQPDEKSFKCFTCRKYPTYC